MTRDKHRLSKAVELLDEAEKLALQLKVSKGSQGSARALSINLRKARDLLLIEAARSDPDWARVAAVLLQAAKWVGAILIDNIQ
jgi:hypothetical protein